MFDDLQAKFCRGLDLSAENDISPCWNGTHVANYTRNLTYFNEVGGASLIYINVYSLSEIIRPLTVKYRSRYYHQQNLIITPLVK